MMKRICTLTVVLLLSASVVGAQQKEPNRPVAPIPPIGAGESSSAAPAGQTDPQPVAQQAADEKPMAGVENPSLGLFTSGSNTLTGMFNLGYLGDTNPNAGPTVGGTSSVRGAFTIGGAMALQQQWTRSNLSLDYSGSGRVYNHGGGSSFNGSHHTMGTRYALQGRLWSFLLRNDFSYYPESSFGGAGAALPGVVPGTQIDPSLIPNQAILSARGARVSDAFTGQVTLTLGPRSSVSGSASYSFLRFLDSGYVNNNRWSTGFTYGYQMTARDTIGGSYTYSKVSFDTPGFGVDSQRIHFDYGRQLTGRLTVHFGVGPNLVSSRNPVVAQATRVSWSMRSNLDYQLNDSTTLGVSYIRGITGGSGVFHGAQTDSVSFNASRQLTSMWSLGANAGYNFNRSVADTLLGLNARRFHSWRGNVTLSRPVGRNSTMRFNYGVTAQNSDGTLCTGTTCGQYFLRHIFGVTFDFNMKPIQLD